MQAILKDKINLAKKLSFLKLWNLSLLYISFYVSRILKKPIQWGLPTSISFEPTTSCNLRCPECPSGLRAFTRKTGMLTPEFFEQTILQLKPTLHYLTFYFQGEPYLNPNFLDMVKYASSKKIYTATSTNAHYLNDENASLYNKLILESAVSQPQLVAHQVPGYMKSAADYEIFLPALAGDEVPK